tara:strand:- start:1331 stop:1762 length:432 start_codon:yes stop_codon:yes gene_type:complete
MRISKRQLKKIIREEKARMLECGEDMAPAPEAPSPGPVVESNSPEHDVLVEMVMASRALEQVVESVQNAAHMCPGCVDEVAVQAPVVEAVVAQAEALQEMLNAQVEVIQENASVGQVSAEVDNAPVIVDDSTPLIDAVIDVVG